MPDLKPITALGDSTARTVKYGALTLEENTGLALASLALRRGTAKPTPFGLGLPGPGLWVGNDNAAALWIGPGQWLVEGPGKAERDFAADVEATCLGCSVTEQTDGFAVFEVRSTAGEAPILALMAKLVNLDPSRFGPGTATRTGLEHMAVFIIRRAPDRLALLGMRTSAGTLWHVLTTVAGQLEIERAA